MQRYFYLALLTIITMVGSARAQVDISVKTDRQYYLVYEPIKTRITIRNNSGNPLTLKEWEDGYVNCEITDINGRIISPFPNRVEKHKLGSRDGKDIIKERVNLAKGLVLPTGATMSKIVTLNATYGMGGKAMAEAGVEILVDSTELGVVGFVEVLKHLRTFKRIFNDLVARAEKDRPDVVVLIDYPGFNLRFAEQMYKRGIKVVYYISPQVWAWGKRRKPKIARFVNRMLVIFPFEEHIYDDYDLPTTFIGHPLIDILRDDSEDSRDDNLVVLLPGSRFSEIDRLFAPMYETALALHKKRPDLRFVVPAPREPIAERIRELIAARPGEVPVDVVVGETDKWLRRGTAGIAASGTVTVQCAIQGLPLVVVYRTNPFTYMLGSLLVKIPYFTMVNLVAEELVFEEFLQADVNPDVLAPALARILPDGGRRKDVMIGIERCIDRLGGRKNASRVAAEAVLAELASKPE